MMFHFRHIEIDDGSSIKLLFINSDYDHTIWLK